jgi:hydrogenase 3 maturation protease
LKYLIVCIGNKEGGDDAVGPYIAEKLIHDELKKSLDMDVLDVGIIPENYTKNIKKKNPDVLFIIDAVDMQLKPGDFRIIPPENIGMMHISTHGIPLSVYIKYLHQYIKKIILIGIQPKKMNRTMSKEVKDAANHLIYILLHEQISQISILEK